LQRQEIGEIDCNWCGSIRTDLRCHGRGERHVSGPHTLQEP
jgi:hypothetical protein